MNEEDIKNLSEIIELCEEEINNNDENVTAILDLEDLKSLKKLIKAYKQIEEKLMYALNPINGELSIKSKENFKKIILENINEDTYTIRKELKKYWNDEINYFRKKCE